MKSLFFNRQSLLFTMMLTAFGLNAQIQSTHTDAKYGYTTVVYKDTTASDADVLSALNSSIGMGDVVRVTVAPPKPAVVPTVDKTKGEDVWLKTKPVTSNITASTAAAVPINSINGKVPVLTRNTASPSINAKAAAVANPPVKKADNAFIINVAPEQVQTAEKMAESPAPFKTKSMGAAKTTKSSNKSVKKANKKSTSYKLKNRKKGKQRYSCPKF